MFTSAESVRTCLALLTDQFLVNHSVIWIMHGLARDSHSLW